MMGSLDFLNNVIYTWNAFDMLFDILMNDLRIFSDGLHYSVPYQIV